MKLLVNPVSPYANVIIMYLLPLFSSIHTNVVSTILVFLIKFKVFNAQWMQHNIIVHQRDENLHQAVILRSIPLPLDGNLCAKRGKPAEEIFQNIYVGLH